MILILIVNFYQLSLMPPKENPAPFINLVKKQAAYTCVEYECSVCDCKIINWRPHLNTRKHNNNLKLYEINNNLNKKKEEMEKVKNELRNFHCVINHVINENDSKSEVV